MFSAYSEDKEALADFIHLFKKACEDKVLISDIFSRTEWDERIGSTSFSGRFVQLHQEELQKEPISRLFSGPTTSYSIVCLHPVRRT